MNNKVFFRTFCALILFIGPIALTAMAEQKVLTVGSIDPNIAGETAKFQPFIDYVAAHLKNYGIEKGHVEVVATSKEIVDKFKKKEVDLYIDSPFPTLLMQKRAGVVPFLRRWKNGAAEYHSVIFVRKDSGIEKIEDLKGKMIAFKYNYSTSSYFLPKATLLGKGLQLTNKENPMSAVSPNEVGYVFSNDDENTMVWVVNKKVGAGACHSDDFVSLAKGNIDDVKILMQTVDVPRHVLSHRAGMDPKLVDEIEKVLVSMDQDAEGQKILKNFGKTKKFDRFPNGAKKDLQPIEKLYLLMENEF